MISAGLLFYNETGSSDSVKRFSDFVKQCDGAICFGSMVSQVFRAFKGKW